jgi:hypothetical protein
VTTFRSLVRHASAAVDSVAFLTRFCPIFPELRKCGDDFALTLIRAQKDEGTWGEQVNEVWAVGKEGVRGYLVIATEQRDVTMFNWCLDTLGLYSGSSMFQNDDDFRADVEETLVESTLETIRENWFLGARLVSKELLEAWQIVDDDALDPFMTTGERLRTVASIVRKADEYGRKELGRLFLLQCLEKLALAWDDEGLMAFMVELARAPNKDLPRTGLQILKEREVDFRLKPVTSPANPQKLFTALIQTDSVDLAQAALTVYPPRDAVDKKTFHPLFVMASFAAKMGFLRVATYATGQLAGSWPREFKPDRAELNVHPCKDALVNLNGDPGNSTKQVRYVMSRWSHISGDVDVRPAQDVVKLYAEQPFFRWRSKTNTDALSQLIITTIRWLLPQSLIFIVTHYSGRLPGSFPSTVEVISTADTTAFAECVGVLLTHGWDPHNTFLEDCLMKRVEKVDRLARCYAGFCDLVDVVVARRNTTALNDDIIQTVLSQIISKGVGSADGPPGAVIRRLVQAGAHVSEDFVAQASAGKMWGCVVVLAQALDSRPSA